MTTCKEAHRLVSEGLDRKLSLGERTRLQLHLIICIACRNFDGQMLLLRRAMRAFEPPDVQPDHQEPLE